ncbi:MAG: hypothetical protein ACW972_11865 [Promethearchaeota archaeon]|jgi:hypothetical protein
MQSKLLYILLIVCVIIGSIFYISNIKLFLKALFVATNDDMPSIFFFTMPFFAFGPLLFISLKFRKLGGSLIVVFTLVQLIALVIQVKEQEGAELLKFVALYILPQFFIGVCIFATNYFDIKYKIKNNYMN